MKRHFLFILSFFCYSLVSGQLNFDLSKVKGTYLPTENRLLNSDTLQTPIDISLSHHKYEIRLSAFYAPVGDFEQYILFSDGDEWTPRFWSAQLYNLYDTTNPKYKTVRNCNWDSVINNLNLAGFFSLPDQSKLKTKLYVMDGSMFTASYKIGNKYRQYHFNNPNNFREHYPRIKEFSWYEQIIRLFFNSFQIVTTQK